MATRGHMEVPATSMFCDDPFDSIDDLLDFSNDDDALATAEACDASAPLILPPAPAMISVAGGCSGVTSGGAGIDAKPDAFGMCNDVDICNLEWLSGFFSDSEFNFEQNIGSAAGDIKEDPLFRTSSPVSVLEPNTLSGAAAAAAAAEAGAASSSPASSCSSSSSSFSSTICDGTGSNINGESQVAALIIPARARTKRARPRPSACSFILPPVDRRGSNDESFSQPIKKQKKKKKKKKKKKAATADTDEDENLTVAAAAPLAARKCMHCGIQKTPQWRAGPMGPKTLCNACGVRYKSGRLFPEYRPAASPTFVSTVHSNSHKKVVEMRLKACQLAEANGESPQPEATAAAKNCDLLEYIRRRD
ncbi:GATA transcription factor 9 [Apostasia shenzhenica]|uniref:GATA transcription factor 9 n=1 Tax=Apostasia shenzhenica TaxID=1088818 RepID=A0A2I0AJH2_9ASPA|nr:GATA transcription factor 9 [Apostasia shenzhenica]